ncbi:MAG: toprim domain-containing protein [Undibacterium sp.]|nr:toprim domain-containing protein [Undibacterium sp.]
MARFTETEIARLKTEVSVERLIEAAGIVLHKSGKDKVGLCPFHDDHNPSMRVTPTTNLWHCPSCGAGGDVIAWVMKRRGISFRHAVEMLRDDSSLAAHAVGGEIAPIKQGRQRSLPAPIAFDADDRALLKQTVDYYHTTLQQSPEALAYLQKRGITGEAVAHFQLGYANRTLGLRLPEKTNKLGAEIRAKLEKIGIYRESGHEHFNGSVVVPVFDEAGQVSEIYGRKILNNLRKGTPSHLYLPGPHHGIFNWQALPASTEIILCEALIDALTFWCNGFRNVTASYGTEGFTDEHLAAFKRYGIERVLIAYDRDEAGNTGADKVAQLLAKEGISCYRIQFPKGMDANEYALKMSPPEKALALLIRKAEWMAGGEEKRATENKSSAPENEEKPAVPTAVQPLNILPLAAMVDVKPPAAPDVAQVVTTDAIPTPSIASPVPPAPSVDIPVEQSDSELILNFGTRRYRIRGWKKPLNPEALKVNLLVSKDERFHVDSFDLYQAKARAGFIKQAGIELGEAEDVLKHDLGRVLLKLEELQAEHLNAAVTKKDDTPTLTDAEQKEALELLTAPDLLSRILADFDTCGMVGEETNKLVAYLAAVSRQLDKPLAILIQSSSAAGKSSLMDAALAFMPDEAQVRYSAMTGQSLFYMGETSLKHKILAIAEEEGAAQASYALKLLQSDGQVSMASTGKDATTGLLTTHEYKVEGPVMLFLTTTAIDIDEELLNRCVVLTVNESREQTKAIHILQRQRQTLAGLLQDESRDAILTLHRNAQRLLQPLKVVNPYADKLTFLDDKTRTRRDHMKYLSLIRAITFLHQYQREIKTVQHRGKAVRYIEVTPGDIATANSLAHEVLGRTLDELPPQTRKLLTTLHAWVKSESEQQGMQQSDFRFSRRQVRDLTGWGNTQLGIHLARLVEMEYIFEHGARRTGSSSYELAYHGEGDHGQSFLMGLLNCDTLDASTPNSPPMTTGVRGNEAGVRGNEDTCTGSKRPLNAPETGVKRGSEIALNVNADGTLPDIEVQNVQNAHIGGLKKQPSYRSLPVVDSASSIV